MVRPGDIKHRIQPAVGLALAPAFEQSVEQSFFPRRGEDESIDVPGEISGPEGHEGGMTGRTMASERCHPGPDSAISA
jgi:hypothetical protein